MKSLSTLIAVLGASALVIGSLAAVSPVRGAVKYAVKIHEFEGCECDSVCPCIFRRDTTRGDCRGLSVYTVNGTYGSTRLRDVTFVIASTYAGQNMEKSMGKWKGVLYTSDKGTAAEREAVSGLIHAMMGDAYSSLARRTASIQLSRRGDVHELRLGKVGRLRIHGVKSASGSVTTIRDAPSPLAFPVTSCAIADVDTYHDGKASWSFKGRNGFFADLELTSAK